MSKLEWNAADKYKELSETYIREDKTLDKIGLLREVKALFDKFDEDNSEDVKRNYAIELHKLKVELDTRLVRDAKCSYSKASVAVVSNIGNDFREIVFQYWETFGEFRDSFLEQVEKVGRYFVKQNGKIPHILTDIDDTLYANPIEHHGIAGSDESYTPMKFYPGSKLFYEIMKRKHDHRLLGDFYVTILSATPALKKCKKFHDENLIEILGDNFSFLEGETSKTMLLTSGLLGSIGSTLQKGKLSAKPLSAIAGNTKYRKYEQYARLFPEYSFFFIGDNGQGDEIAGNLMIEHNHDCHVFLHNIVENGNRKYNEEEVVKKTTSNMHFFNDYGELANQIGLFTPDEVTEMNTEITMKLLLGGKKKTKTKNRKNEKRKTKKSMLQSEKALIKSLLIV